MAHVLQQGIRDFYDVARVRDFTRNHNFRVESIRTAHHVPIKIESQDLVYAETANLPGRSITNIPTPYMGLDFNVPGLAKYPGSDAYVITFRADGKNIIREMFEQWSRAIFNDEVSSGHYMIHNSSTMQLALLTQGGDILRRYKLWGMYLTECGELVYDMKGNGDVVSFTATFAYQFWTNEGGGGGP